MKFEYIIPVLILAGLLVFSGFEARAANDTVSINISILSVSEITVVPSSLNWTNLNPGTAGGIANLTVKNTGSVGLTNIFAYLNTNETEPARPYGLTAANYSSGSLLVIKNNSASKYMWAQRKEWNWTTPIPNIDMGALDANSRAAWGFFKNASSEYVWAVGNGTGGCNGAGALFAIEDDIDTGTRATRTPMTTTITRDGGDAEYSYFSVSRATAPLSDMCVAVSAQCDYILAYKYDKRSGYTTCANSEYLRAANLPAGETDDMHADAWAPLGLPAGQMTIATMTVQAT